MQCRQCGTEIAEKALICFRCGAPVQEAVTPPAPLKPSRPLAVYALFAAIVVVALLTLWLQSQ